MALVVEQLSGQERGGPSVHRVSLTVAPGECLTLLGPPESGTEQLLRLVAGQRRAGQGRIWLGGQEIGALPAARRPLRLLDLRAPLPPRRVLGDLLVGGLPDGLADLLGLRGLEAEPLGWLAPPLRVRASLALALAEGPGALLLPEPGAALAPNDRDELFALLVGLAQALQIPLLAASAEPETAFALGGRVGVMHAGRLLEAGSVQEIYLRPQTDVGAAALGPVNLLVGSCVGGGVRVGPFVFPTRVGGGEGQLRVQLMFRPEDVELAGAAGDLVGTPLGLAEVAALRFAGRVERLRLRLPPVPGVRPVAPTPPFGEAGLLIEAVRSAAQARRAPLRAGEAIWAGVRRFHALPHPGLHLAVVGVESAAARRLAELAAARLSSVAAGDDPPELALERLHRRQPCDLAVLSGAGAQSLALLDRLLEHSSPHLLLLDGRSGPPLAGLICVAGDEGDKETVRFAARLLRHLGASAALLTVLSGDEQPAERIRRFHAAAGETMAALGVPMRSLFRSGERAAAIIAERRAGGHDLLVVGSRAPGRRGPQLAQELARQREGAPLLIVRPAGLTALERAQGGLMAGLLAGDGFR